MSSLTRIVPWSQQLACEVLRPGDLAVDLTAGKGRDTLALARAVGPTGRVIAFDVQEVALAQTAWLLEGEGLGATRWECSDPIPETPGIYLVRGCHATLGDLVRAPVRAVMANLGYLPGGDPALITTPDITLAALRQACALLDAGGRLAVTLYPGHSGGEQEGAAVDAFLNALPRDDWEVLALTVANRPEAPRLRVVERRPASLHARGGE